MPGIFTLARRNVRACGTIVLGFWGDVKGFWSRIFRIAEDFQDCWRGIDCCAGDHFSLSEAGFAGFWGDFQDGRGAANRCVFGRVFDRCLNCDFWDIEDGLWASFQF